MAQTTAVNAILGNLVTSTCGVSSARNPREHKQLKDAAAKTAKAQQFVRTNQFEVEASLNGLVEKFTILNRDDLSEALRVRLDELRQVSRSKWTPEILSLFLNLSDRPVEKSNLQAMELLRPPTPPPPSITWEEIVADDPLTGDLWADETYSTASSEDELEPYAAEPSAADRKPKSKSQIEPDPPGPIALLVPIDRERLTAIKQAQFWKASAESPSGMQTISELQTIREVNFMLRGLPTSLFTMDIEHSVVFYSANIKLTGVSVTSFNDLLQSLASIGSDILSLRAWIRSSRHSALLQALNASTASRLQQFDNWLAEDEHHLVDSGTPVLVTLLQLHEDVRKLSRPLVYLGQLVASVPSRGFTCLELLYDKICISQASEDTEVYELLAYVFFDCLRVYLRPVRRWMEVGDAADADDTFFISVADKNCAPSSLWHDRFALRNGQDGHLYAPKFLRPAAKKILNAGKSIVFLKQLLQQGFSPSVHTEPILDFDTVCQSQSFLSLAPFSELFGTAFDSWISSKYSLASSILRQQLFNNCSLSRFLDGLQHTYLSKDGSFFQAFADEIFQRMDGRQKSWGDRFLLSELARSVFGSQACVDADRISVRTIQTKGADRGLKALSSILVEFNLPWPILNVMQRTSLASYQRTFRLLLQIYRAKYLLRQNAFQLRQVDALYATNRLSDVVRQRLGWFVDIIQSYITDTVIETAIMEMGKHMAEAEDIDAMTAVHQKFIARLQLRGLLAKNLAPIHDSIISILDLVVDYTDNQTRELGKQSASQTTRPQHRRRQGKGRSKVHYDSSSDDDGDNEEEEDDDYDADSENSIVRDESYDERLRKIQDQFGQLLNFTVAGLRGVGRAGGELSWEMLAERLEWGSNRVGG